ncbi:response regulator [Paenibacillus glycinis]|uniref:Response regulator n=1 Tax=Paenibacillus glycinis TaxID=2697035 RepID=A0ABW9XYV6_9BACL|nr:response regulator [Paenibacillus glycinis]NBD27814.1 response regulator [Paenibacillus glycinis]
MYKVLLVDDEPFAIQGLQLMVDWEKRGFRVAAVCDNGEEALRHIRSDPPDLVVTDIRMPVLDGLQLIEETRRSGNRTTLFVIASGYDDFDYARRAIRLGVSHFLTKPVMGEEADEVLVRLQGELRGRERDRMIRDSADRYEIGQALSALLAGGDVTEGQPAMQAISRLSGRAREWTYLGVETDAETAGPAREAAQRFAAERSCCYVVDGGRESFGLVFGSDCGGRDEDGIREVAARLLEAMRAGTNGRIGLAVGCAADGLRGIAESYGSAAEAGRFLFFGGGAIVHYADVRDLRLSFDPEALGAADAIVDAMESGDPSSVAAAVRAAFRAFESRMVLPELVALFSTRVLMRGLAVYQELGGDPDGLLTGAELCGSGRKGRQLREIERELSGFCLKCQAAVDALHGKRTGGTPSKVAEYLRQHFRETLTIKEIAERFYIHPVYLGQAFSRKYGKGLLDFVHDLRIDEAKRLLGETDAAAGAVAEAVGYRGYQHFLKQFEKRLGMKPADYRLACVGRIRTNGEAGT